MRLIPVFEVCHGSGYIPITTYPHDGLHRWAAVIPTVQVRISRLRHIGGCSKVRNRGRIRGWAGKFQNLPVSDIGVPSGSHGWRFRVQRPKTLVTMW